MLQIQHNRKIIPEGVGFSGWDVYKRPFSARVRWSFRGTRPGVDSRIFVFAVRPPLHRIRAKRAMRVGSQPTHSACPDFLFCHSWHIMWQSLPHSARHADRSTPSHAGGRHLATDFIHAPPHTLPTRGADRRSSRCPPLHHTRIPRAQVEAIPQTGH